MKYIIANTQVAEQFGFDIKYHRKNESLVILNEKEVMSCPAMAEYHTFEQRASILESEVYSYAEIQNILNSNTLNL